MFNKLKATCQACGPDMMLIEDDKQTPSQIVGIFCRLCLLYPPPNKQHQQLIFIHKGAWSTRNNEISKHFIIHGDDSKAVHLQAIKAAEYHFKQEKQLQLFTTSNTELVPVGKKEVSNEVMIFPYSLY